VNHFCDIFQSGEKKKKKKTHYIKDGFSSRLPGRKGVSAHLNIDSDTDAISADECMRRKRTSISFSLRWFFCAFSTVGGGWVEAP